MYKVKKRITIIIGIVGVLGTSILLTNCLSGVSREKENTTKPLALPVHEVAYSDAVTVKDYIGNIEGKVNVEIRPQVEGLLQEIYVDEGEYVEKGQKLFKIDPSTYQENLNNMIATEQVAKAKLKNAKLEIDRLKPLVDNDVISGVRLAAARSDYEVAKATLDQASAAVRSAQINKDFTIITAPVSGYIDHIPKRVGNLVGKGDKEPLTYLSDVQEIYVYFSMSESDYLYFSKVQAHQDSLNGIQYNENKQLTFPEVTLVLADGEEYSKKGV